MSDQPLFPEVFSAVTLPVLVVGARHALWLSPEGELQDLSLNQARSKLLNDTPLVCHAPSVGKRLRGPKRFRCFDILELFAFALPAVPCLPTPAGVAACLHLDRPHSPEEEALVLQQAAGALLEIITQEQGNEQAQWIVATMARAGWPWAKPVLQALGAEEVRPGPRGGLDVWTHLPEWEEVPPDIPADDVGVEEQEAQERLKHLLGSGAEDRQPQHEYAGEVATAFNPRNMPGTPNVVLAEAGTGVGKTLGYIAPASVWSDKAKGAVWLSTYTKNLQRQIDQELTRLYPDKRTKDKYVVVRKGRENYLCLLNYEEAVSRSTLLVDDNIGLGLMARWAGRSRDGDLVGGDFPSWLTDLVGRVTTIGLADRRGECIYSACLHYRKCFIERNIRRARQAKIVIANHALVMIQAAGGRDDQYLPTRFVFDEGHHVFDAADSAFAVALSGREAAELRRWLRGTEERRKSGRARGLASRVSDLLGSDGQGEMALHQAVEAASCLPAEGWLMRVVDGAPTGASEHFFVALRDVVYARAQGLNSPFSLECGMKEPPQSLLEAAYKLEQALSRLAEPLATLAESLARRLDTEAGSLDSQVRVRIEAVVRSLRQRLDGGIHIWRAMLHSLKEGPAEGFVDWLSVERFDRQDMDVGLHRHWIDPTIPFTEAVMKPAHGVTITSATLLDRSDDTDGDDWHSAEIRTGALHLPTPAKRFGVHSPFDYGKATKVFVVTDVNKDNPDQVAAAYRELFLAADGGALGLFTAIGRLRQIHQRLIEPLDAAGIDLLAQHVDPMDAATLVDIFRAEDRTCLLGTDAMRDGVDVPGLSLRMLVFDRVPWPRPTLLHRARREAFGGRGYDEMLARLKLKQAFGRLVRRSNDVGVFVLLDGRTPSKLLDAFPTEVEVHRVGLKEAVEQSRAFLAPHLEFR